jgi:hypothetical protein
MAGPWEDYQQQPASQDGPWTDYQRKPGAAPAAPPTATRSEPPGSLWQALVDETTAPGRFARGVAEGVGGAGVPEGKGSEQPIERGKDGDRGGQAGGIGRAVGAGVRGAGSGLWDVISAPGKILTEGMTKSEMEQKARSTAMMMAGGGWRPGLNAAVGSMARPVQPSRMQPPRMQETGQPPAPTGQVGAPSNFRANLEAGGRTLGEAPPGGAPGPQPGMMPPGPRSPVAPPPPTPRPPPPVEAPRNPAADAMTAGLYRQAVRPPGAPRSRANNLQTKAQNQDIVTGVDQIIQDRPILKLTGPDGAELPPGTAPRTMSHFSEAIEQSEISLFQQWDPMTRRAGDKGLRIDLAPAVAELRAMAKKPEIAHVNLDLPAKYERYADVYEKQGFYTPLEAQNVIKGINKERTADGRPDETLEPVARILRKQLDEGIADTEGPGWQDLRDKYKALQGIKGDVAKAVQRIANRPKSGLSQFGNAVSAMELIRAGLGHPDALARAVGAQGAKALNKFFNDPNRQIQRLFDRRMATPPPSSAPYGVPPARAGVIGSSGVEDDRLHSTFRGGGL